MRSVAAGVALVALGWLGGCDGPSQVGDPCQADDQCGEEDGFTLSCQVSTPGGYCTVRDCTPDDPATAEVEGADTCPSSSRCMQDGVRPSFVCRLSCETRGDCRPVWVCAGGECADLMTCAPVHPEQGEDEGAARACVFAPVED